MAKKSPYAGGTTHPSHAKLRAMVDNTGTGASTRPMVGKAHRVVPGKGKVSTTQLAHAMGNTRQKGC